MNRILVLLMAILVMTIPGQLLAQSSEQPTRLWKQRDGQSSFHAALIEFDEEKGLVTLRLKDDTEVELPATDLSNVDRGFLKRYSRKLQRQAKRSVFERSRSNVVATESELLESDKPALSTEAIATKPKTGKAGIVDRGTIRRLYGIDWHSTAKGAQTAATGKPGVEDDRPIIWFRVLGDLADGM